MSKKYTFVSWIFVVAFFVLTVQPAFAALGKSDDKIVTVNGITYAIWSDIHNLDKGKINYQTTVSAVNVNSVPVGYMGVQAKLYSYQGGGALASSDWFYNVTEVKSQLAAAPYYTSDGYYHSMGAVVLYNGKGYEGFTSYQTPNFAPSRVYSPQECDIAVQRNEKGEIYGSELFLSQIGVQADLILAESPDGIVGYVRAEDLNNNNVRTPEDAIAYMMSREQRSIPLYECDGETIIGSFLVG